MYTNDLLKEKYMTQRNLSEKARENNEEYINYIEHDIKKLFKDNNWQITYSNRKGGYINKMKKAV